MIYSFKQEKDDFINNRKFKREPLVSNIGTGVGYSVLDMVKAFKKASSKHISYKIVERRAGDIAKCYADSSYAKEVLGW